MKINLNNKKALVGEAAKDWVMLLQNNWLVVEL